jgi:hypothetical protein
MKNIIFIFFSVILSASTVLAGNYNFKNDYLYKDILQGNNIIAKNWCVAKKSKLPVQLLNFKVISGDVFENTNGKKVKGFLVPLEVIEFRVNGFFNFYWLKNDYTAGNISGSWRIENSMLILVLSKDYIKPYLKGEELRYEIIGTNHSKTKLLFKGKKYSPITGIINTTDDIINDLERIIIAMDQKIVSDKFPEIIKTKEMQLRESLLNNKN